MTREQMREVVMPEGDALFSWSHLPSWAQEGQPDYDGNWTPDCGGKLDYDPGFMRFSCRVYRDGDYFASLYLGDDTEVAATGIVKAGSVQQARADVEAWCRAQATKFAAIIAAAIRAQGAPK